MYRRILVGYDGTDGGRDALALARELRAPDGTVIAACVYPTSGRNSGNGAGTQLSDAAARAVAEAPAQIKEDWLETRTMPGHSPAHGLHVLSEEVEADLVVVGSAKRGSSGQVLAGSTGDRLLNGSPCAVAVAPLGFETEAGAPRVVGVAYDGSDESQAALDQATEIAEELDATLRVVTAIPPLQHFWSAEAFTAGIAGGDEIRAQRHEAFRQQLATATESCPPEVRAAPALAEGRPADVIVDEAERGIHLLFVGSRSYGPIRRVMVGSTAIELMRRASCPVVVMPRGAIAHARHARAETPETTRVI
jgi:nucleotide-binding universal stress UspA family protein